VQQSHLAAFVAAESARSAALRSAVYCSKHQVGVCRTAVYISIDGNMHAMATRSILPYEQVSAGLVLLLVKLACSRLVAFDT
jgi:hypothetical protein